MKYRFATVVFVLLNMLLLPRCFGPLDAPSQQRVDMALVVAGGITLLVCLYIVIPWFERMSKRRKD